MSAAPIRVVCTGHQGLEGAFREQVDHAIRMALPAGPFVGACSLAEGADRIFAQIALEAYDALDVVISSDNSDTSVDTPKDRGNYLRLLNLASCAEHLDSPEQTEEAVSAARK